MCFPERNISGLGQPLSVLNNRLNISDAISKSQAWIPSLARVSILQVLGKCLHPDLVR
jgi:hypothetical protein